MEYREFITELNIRLQTVEVVHRHLMRLEDSCNESSRLGLADISEEHLSGMLGEQERETYKRLVREVGLLDSLVRKGRECFGLKADVP